jgi:hypothetical protein
MRRADTPVAGLYIDQTGFHGRLSGPERRREMTVLVEMGNSIRAVFCQGLSYSPPLTS